MNILQILTLCVVSIKCMYIQFNLISYQFGMFHLFPSSEEFKFSSCLEIIIIENLLQLEVVFFVRMKIQMLHMNNPIWMYLYIPVHVSVAYWNKDWCTLLNWHKYILINVNIYLVHNKIKIPWYKCYGFYCAV